MAVVSRARTPGTTEGQCFLTHQVAAVNADPCMAGAAITENRAQALTAASARRPGSQPGRRATTVATIRRAAGRARRGRATALSRRAACRQDAGGRSRSRSGRGHSGRDRSISRARQPDSGHQCHCQGPKIRAHRDSLPECMSRITAIPCGISNIGRCNSTESNESTQQESAGIRSGSSYSGYSDRAK